MHQNNYGGTVLIKIYQKGRYDLSLGNPEIFWNAKIAASCIWGQFVNCINSNVLNQIPE